MYLIELNSWLLPSNRCATYNAIVMRLKPPCNIDGKWRATWVSVVWKPAWRKQKLEEQPWACTVQAVSLVLVLFLAQPHQHLEMNMRQMEVVLLTGGGPARRTPAPPTWCCLNVGCSQEPRTGSGLAGCPRVSTSRGQYMGRGSGNKKE